MKIKVGIAEDQQLFLRSLSALINTFQGFEVVLEALDGDELLARMKTIGDQPDILLLDVCMPSMDGIATAQTVATRYPLVKMAALTQKDDDSTVIRMIRAGCSAYF